MACYAAAGQLEKRIPRLGEALYLRACRLGVTSGCTNRAAGILVQEADRPDGETCAARTFELTCARRDPWGCTMLGNALMKGQGIAQDLARARQILAGSCRLGEADDACRAARELMGALDYPRVEGEYQLTKDWWITLADPVRRRFEDGTMIFWRPGFTVFVKVWEQGGPEALKQVEASSDDRRYDVLEESDGGLLRYAYRLDEHADDERRPAFHGFVVGARSYVQIGVYFDDEKDLAAAMAVWRSLAEPRSAK